ncbi:hypothetical protein Holit_03106 [Hollandina sp. SP2]
MIYRLFINRFNCLGIPVRSFIVLGAFLLLSSCQNEGRWYPDAEVSIKNSVEYLDPASGAKALLIILVIHSTSHTSIDAEWSVNSRFGIQPYLSIGLNAYSQELKRFADNFNDQNADST